MRLLIIRHAESKKNISNIIGGSGSRLTVRGVSCSKRTALRVKATRQKPTHIYCAPTIQTRATSLIIKDSIPSCPLLTDHSLTPIKLGKLSGAKTCDAQQANPTELASLKLWNQGKADIAELTITDMQTPWDFYLSGLKFLTRIRRTTRCACVVATRSSLILLWHIKKRNTPDPGCGYKNKLFPYHRPVLINLTIHDFIWIKKQIRKNGTLMSSV